MSGALPEGWMTDTFFTGYTLPSDQLLLHFVDHVKIDDHWIVSGLHYKRTLEAWLIEIDKKSEVLPVLEKAYVVSMCTLISSSCIMPDHTISIPHHNTYLLNLNRR